MPPTKTKSKIVIRLGDIVKVVKPMVLDRVGYDVNYKDVYSSFLEEEESNNRSTNLKRARNTNDEPVLKDKALEALINDFCNAVRTHVSPPKSEGCFTTMLKGVLELNTKVTKTVLKHVARQTIAKEMRANGQERQKYEHEVPDLAGCTMQVVGRRIVKTGTRYAPSGGGGWNGEYEDEWEPGYLAKEKTHIVYKIRHQIMPESYVNSENEGGHHDYEIDKSYLEYLCPVANRVVSCG